LNLCSKSVSECYKNQKRIDQACKQLTSQSNLLAKQSQAWITLIGQFTDALKVCFLFLFNSIILIKFLY
jgi:hypothetical protein